MKYELNRPTDYSDDAILNEIRRVANLVVKPLTRSKFKNNSKYNPSTVERRFGSWLEALNKAGLDESYQHKDNIKISTEEIITEVRRIADKLETNSFSRLRKSDRLTPPRRG